MARDYPDREKVPSKSIFILSSYYLSDGGSLEHYFIRCLCLLKFDECLFLLLKDEVFVFLGYTSTFETYSVNILFLLGIEKYLSLHHLWKLIVSLQYKCDQYEEILIHLSDGNAWQSSGF